MELRRHLRLGAELGMSLTAITALILAGCGGGGGATASGGADAAALVTPMKGQFCTSATVTVLDKDNLVIGTGSVNASGVVSVDSISSSAPAPYVVQVGAGASASCYYDEVTASNVAIPANTTALHAVVPSYAALTSASGFAVTPLTEMAYQYLDAAGTLAVAADVTAANDAVASGFGLTDILQTPTLIGPATAPLSNSTSQANRYALAIAALSQTAAASATMGQTTLEALLAQMPTYIASGIPATTYANAYSDFTGGASSVLAAPVAATGSAPTGSLDDAINGGGPLTVTSFSPSSGAAGTTVTITGTNFDPDPFHMQVSFGGNVSATIVSASSTQLVVTVPAGASTGKIKVTNGLTLVNDLSATNFTVTGSTPSNTWTPHSSGSAFILNTVTYGNGLFVAGGMGYTILSSPDGINWTSRSSSGSPQPDADYYSVNGLAWSSARSLFIAVGDRTCCSTTVPPLLATSPDGITWTRASLAAGTYSGASLADVTADSNGITAVGAGYIFYSTDGSAWSSQAVPAGMGATLAITGVASSGATRVAVGYDSNITPAAFILVSTDASTWSSVSAPSGFAPQDVVWNGSLFVAVGSSSPIQMGVTPQIATSSDGQTWTLQTMPPAVASSAYMLNDIAWDGTRFIAVGSPYALVNSRLILSSTDGSTWAVEQEITTGSGQKVLNGIASSGTVSVTVGDSVFTNP